MFARGAIGFSTHKRKRLSRIIRWFTGQPWSHTFIVADIVGNRKTNEHRVYLLDAFKREASFNSIKMYESDDTSFEIWSPKKDLIPSQIDAALATVEKEFLKQPYSFASLVGIGIKMTVKAKLGWIIRNPLHLGVYCGQMTFRYLEELNLRAAMTTQNLWDAGSVSPGDLYKFVSTCGLFEKTFAKGYIE